MHPLHTPGFEVRVGVCRGVARPPAEAAGGGGGTPTAALADGGPRTLGRTFGLAHPLHVQQGHPLGPRQRNLATQLSHSHGGGTR